MNDIGDHPDIVSAERTGYPEGKVPVLAGSCEACSGDMYEYERTECGDCTRIVHTGCIVECIECGHEGCKKCMIYSEYFGEWFSNKDCEIERLKTYKTELEEKLRIKEQEYLKAVGDISRDIDETNTRRKELES